MKFYLSFVFLTVATAALGGSGSGSREDAIAMVNAVVHDFDKDGAEKTFKAISDKTVTKFHDRDLYPFVLRTDGLCVAQGARPALIGRNLYDLKDQDGQYLIRDMIKQSWKGAGWINYKWPHPSTNAIDDKTTYVTKLGNDYVVGVGIYGVSR